nr:Cap [Trichosanthes kirilowii CRESS virus]
MVFAVDLRRGRNWVKNWAKRQYFGKWYAPKRGTLLNALLGGPRGTNYQGRMSGKVQKFYPARKSIRKYRRGRKIYKKVVKRPALKSLQTGVSFQIEKTNAQTDTKCVYVGHTTAVPYDQLRCFFMLMIKLVLQTAGIQIESFTDPINLILASGDKFILVYKTNLGSGGVVYKTNLGSGGVTGVGLTVTINTEVKWYDIAENMLAQFLLSAASPSFISLYPIEMQYLPVSGRYQTISLIDAQIEILSKSALKIQNRSVANTGDDELDVNNVPLNGKLYSGPGRGPVLRSRADVNLLATYDGGYTSVGAASNTEIQEPPHAGELLNVKKFAKVRMNPGDLKTSVINFKTTISIAKFLQKCASWYVTSNITSNPYDLGAFRCFALERMIAPVAGEIATQTINIGFEVDRKIWMRMKPTKQLFSTAYHVVN